MTFKALLATAPLFAACAIDALEQSELHQAIEGDGTLLASTFQRDRAVWAHACTATKISARWILTDAHCANWIDQDSSPSTRVNFYQTGPGMSAQTAIIDKVVLRPGVSASACLQDIDDCYDSSGLFADIALMRLRMDDEDGTEANLEGHQATLAWAYPGADVYGKKVGAGRHDDEDNPERILKQHADYTESDSDSDGQFTTVDEHTDDGDSGGPFYHGSKVLGVLWGEAYVPFDHFNIYTSVPRHLNWILSTIDYQWRGQPPQSNTHYAGTTIQSFYGSERECQYACEKTASCEAYNYNAYATFPSAPCQLHDNITSVTTASGWKGALKYGAAQGNAGEIVGYVRSDGKNAVVHRSTDNRVHELLLDGTWQWEDIHGSAPAIGFGSKLSAYRRSDGINAVVYRSSANHIIELALTSSGWKSFDLTDVTGGELAAGSPMAYVRADGVSAIVYRGADSGHIIELRLGTLGWIARDLSIAAGGSSTIADSDPAAFVRSDGISSVVFRSTTNYVVELYMPVGEWWSIGWPSYLAGAPTTTIGRPFGFTHSNGTNAIVYRTSTGQLIQLTLSGSQWTWSQLASNAVGDVTAYTRTDGVESVVFMSSSSKIVEAANGNVTDLTSTTGAPTTVTSPAVYHRSDRYNAVLFESSGGPARELYFKLGGSWSDGNISAVAGETP